MDKLGYLYKAAALPVGNHMFKGSPFQELVKLELNAFGETTFQVDYECLDATLNLINERKDCADFFIQALVAILKNHRGTERLPEEYAQKIENTLIGFKYWIDEPGETNACYFTENHQILYHTAEYLVGQMFPEQVFPSNGKNGKWHREHSLVYIRRWLDWRVRFGYSEWLTDGYYCEDLESLVSLWKYAQEEDVKKTALMLVDMTMFDIAVNSKDGYLCTTHGRVYAPSLLRPESQGTTHLCAMFWGKGNMEHFSNVAALMAVYDYQPPKAICEVGRDNPVVMQNHERTSIDVEDAKFYGADPKDFDNIMLFWGIQAYSHRDVIENSLKVFYPYWNWMVNRFKAYKERYDRCDEAGVPAIEGTPDYTAMTQADIHTYRTRDYSLSCVQDFRKGRMGYQQHVWSAYLGENAHVFTTSPGSEDYHARPNQVAGNLFLPRAAAFENVLICIYRIQPDFVDYLYTHAYFPRDEFDEVTEQNGWLFGRKGTGYIALRSLLPARWREVNEKELENEVPGVSVRQSFDYMAPGHANVWVTELGSESQNGSFKQFCSKFTSDALTGDTFCLTYQSPSLGQIDFGWIKPFAVNGKEINLHGYKRYDNPYCQAEFNSKRLEINCGGYSVVLDFEHLERKEKEEKV
ncbi:hypothetical protein [Eisenbergiella porci]|jgi:hypothetical protein|uniref:hypothetical protein n=1 Tax=Eisenbergiella porci TaxID=2652274 RepID=UPI002A833DE8|nr:hypothetical protein [Eisenbergiella porci]